MAESPFELTFPTRLIGRRGWYFAQLDSTSQRILNYAADATNNGLLVLTDEQTAGRGTRGRHWYCPAGGGLLFSVLLFPPVELRRPVLFSSLAAVSVCQAIFTQLHQQANIKWPNDVLLNDKKVCGILIDMLPTATVMGIGINIDIAEQDFLDQGLPQAGSLAQFVPELPNRMELLGTLLNHLDHNYAAILAGQMQNLENLWRKHSQIQDKQVVVQAEEEVVLGRLVALSFEAIEVRNSAGATVRFKPEQVSRISLVH